MECILIGLRAYFIQHMGSFNYGKIRTMGAVLVAISIPIFTSQSEKSREATDAANIRAAYAQASVKVLESEADVTYKVNCVQTTAGFSSISDLKIGGVDVSGVAASKTAPVYITVHANGNAPTINTTEVAGAETFN